MLIIPRIAPATLDGEAFSPRIFALPPTVSRFHRTNIDRTGQVGAAVETAAWLAFSEERLHVAFRCAEPFMDQLAVGHTRPKREMSLFPVVSLDDTVEALIDIRHDLERCVHLLVNARGDRYSSRHRTSAFRMEGDSDWSPGDWVVRTHSCEGAWLAVLSVSARDLGVERFSEGDVVGLNLIRHRTPVRELYQLQPGTLAWTTQWTSELIHEAYRFVPAALGRCEDEGGALSDRAARTRRFLTATPGHDHSADPAGPAMPPLAAPCSERQGIQTVNGRPFWMFLPDYARLPGLEETAFRLARPFLALERFVGGSRYGAIHIEPGRCMKAAVREVEIWNDRGENVAPKAALAATPAATDLERLTDGRDDRAACITANRFYPMHGVFEFRFPEPERIARVVLKHGEPFGGTINGVVVPFKNMASEFILHAEANGEFTPLKGGVVRGKGQAETEHVFAGEETGALRLEILSQTYSGIEYGPDDAWRWFFEDRCEVPVHSELNAAMEGVFREVPSEEDLRARPVMLEYLRYLREGSMCARGMEPMFREAVASLRRMNPEGFLGSLMWEWDSDLETLCCIHEWRNTGSGWERYVHELPPAEADRAAAQALWRDLFERCRRRHCDAVVAVSSWRLGSHFDMAWGNRLPFVELSPNGQPSMQAQIACVRGAARQFDAPWGAYLAVCLGTGAVNHFNRTDSHAGEETWTRNGDAGPSPLFYRRMLFYACFSGATFLAFESVPELHLIPNEDWTRFSISPFGEALCELLEYREQFPERGTPYAPIGVLLDGDHGYAAPYQSCYAFGRSGRHTWIKTPYTESDRVTNAVVREIFPYSVQRIERDNYMLYQLHVRRPLRPAGGEPGFGARGGRHSERLRGPGSSGQAGGHAAASPPVGRFPE